MQNQLLEIIRIQEESKIILDNINGITDTESLYKASMDMQRCHSALFRYQFFDGVTH